MSSPELEGDTDTQRYLGRVIAETPGLVGIILSDGEGVPVVQAWSEVQSESSELCDALMTTSPPILRAAGSNCINKCGRFGIGKCKWIDIIYQNHVMSQINHDPVYLTMVGNNDAILGFLHEKAKCLAPVIEAVTPLISTEQSKTTESQRV